MLLEHRQLFNSVSEMSKLKHSLIIHTGKCLEKHAIHSVVETLWGHTLTGVHQFPPQEERTQWILNHTVCEDSSTLLPAHRLWA